MLDEVRRQFDLAWALTELHLDALTEADFLWEPADLCWTVHRGEDGTWVADFAEVEPDPVPVPTIAWLTWHIDFWWSAAIATLAGDELPEPTSIRWAGTGEQATARVRDLAAQWRNTMSALTSDDLAAPTGFPWPESSGRTVADTVLWVTVELTKNAAEIGQLRLLRAACR
ncbi:DinB family protein [Mycolicibacterium iranicum]|nr:DinB family protein [Mycolicibacterium iranicum]